MDNACRPSPSILNCAGRRFGPYLLRTIRHLRLPTNVFARNAPDLGKRARPRRQMRRTAPALGFISSLSWPAPRGLFSDCGNTHPTFTVAGLRAGHPARECPRAELTCRASLKLRGRNTGARNAFPNRSRPKLLKMYFMSGGHGALQYRRKGEALPVLPSITQV